MYKPELPSFNDSEAVEAFAQITRLGESLRIKALKQTKGQRDYLYDLPGRVDLGKFAVDGKTFEVVYGAFDHPARSVYEDGQPRAYRMTGGWVLAVGEVSVNGVKPNLLTPIAYEADFAALDDGLKRPLVEHIQSWISATRVNGKVA